MRQRPCEARVRSLIDTDPPDDGLGRMARVDALLRGAAAKQRDGCRQPRARRKAHKLELSNAELLLIYRSLEAAKTLRVVHPQDELLDDTLQLVSQALKEA